MTAFGDSRFAADLRDVIERISGGVINRERPEPFLGKVYDYDLNNQKARVVLAGETTSNLMTVSFALDKVPTTAMIDTFATLGEAAVGDIVRITGKPGAYFIMDYVSGAPKAQFADSAVLHANSSYENTAWVNGYPFGWEAGWNTGTWSASLDQTDRVDGNYSLKIFRASGATTRVVTKDAFAVTAGQIIRISGWVKCRNLTTGTGSGGTVDMLFISNTTAAGAQYFASGAQQQVVSFGATNTFWTRYEAEFVVPATHAWARFDFLLSTGLASTNLEFKVDATISQVIVPVPWIAVDGSTPGSTNLFINGWVNYAAGWEGASFRRIGDMVYMRGLVKNGTGIIFYLPFGYRPKNNLLFATDTNPSSHGRMDVDADGAVVVQAGNTSYFGINCAFSIT